MSLTNPCSHGAIARHKIEIWNYRAQEPEIREIVGPQAFRSRMKQRALQTTTHGNAGEYFFQPRGIRRQLPWPDSNRTRDIKPFDLFRLSCLRREGGTPSERSIDTLSYDPRIYTHDACS